MFLCAWTYTYDVTTPTGDESPTLGDDRIREVKASLQERLDIDHYFPLTASQVSNADAGMHRFITFEGPNTTPASVPAGQGKLYTKTVNGLAELFWIDANENGKQLTRAGKINVLGTDGAVLVTDDQDVNGIKTFLQYPILPSADPTEDRHTASKGYVDTKTDAISSAVAFGSWTNLDNQSNALLKAHRYKVTSDGFVSIQANTLTDYEEVVFYSDSVNATTVRWYSEPYLSGSGRWLTISGVIPVKKYDYWKMNTGASATMTAQWMPMGADGNCIDQD